MHQLGTINPIFSCRKLTRADDSSDDVNGEEQMRKTSKLPAHNYSSERRQTSLDALTIDQLRKAQEALLSYIPPTPIIDVNLAPLGVNSHCRLKLENVTPTGSFKIRGATFCLIHSAVRSNGSVQVVTASTGNHGIGLAWAGQQLGIKVTVVAPGNIPDRKIEKLERFGAHLLIKGQTLDEAIEWARANMVLDNALFIPSFNPRVIVGHSTLALELFQKSADLDTVFFPIGVGSGITGLTLARDLLNMPTKIVGVVPHSVRAWAKSWNLGHPTPVRPADTLADGLRTALPDQDIFMFLKHKLSNVLEVTESDIQEVQEFCSKFLSFSPEPAGVVGFAGLIKFARAQGGQADSLAAVICG
jgi:threonine dehydratase